MTVDLPHNPNHLRSDAPNQLRSDALDNRERILDAARAAFTADGLDVPMREIARRAGVAPATVYRHFPTKQLLATEAFTDQVGACRAIVDEGLAHPDPWHGFRLVIEKVCELHARNRGFAVAARIAASRRFAALAIQAFQALPACCRWPGTGRAGSRV